MYDDGIDFYDSGPGGTGYEYMDIGQRLKLTTGNPKEGPRFRWYMSIALPGLRGARDFRDAIINCWTPSGDSQIGNETLKEPGNMVGPTRQAFGDIWSDPYKQGQSWDDTMGWPVHSDGTPVSVSSHRIRPIVMFDTRVWLEIENGRKTFPITNLAGI